MARGLVHPARTRCERARAGWRRTPESVTHTFPHLMHSSYSPHRATFEATMQDYKEIDRIRKNLVAVRSLAERLLRPITTRQCEKLLELRDDAEYYSSVRGFGVQSLIQNCWLARDDLESEDDRKFIEHLKETSCSSVKRRQLRKLLACARQLLEIEQYVSIDR
jgi:hypothetical protein